MNMAAAPGNKNALGNNGGRPPYYDASKPEDIETVTELCKTYFEILISETFGKPPTVTGLALHLGFDCKNTLYDYAKKIEFSNPIKRALTTIEQYHEEMAAGGDKCVGNIFVLKNFGWRDTMDLNHGGQPENPINLSRLSDAALAELEAAAEDEAT